MVSSTQANDCQLRFADCSPQLSVHKMADLHIWSCHGFAAEREREHTWQRHTVARHTLHPTLLRLCAHSAGRGGRYTSNKALASLTRLKQSYYNQGEKASKLLAWRIKALQNERAINEIQTPTGDLTSDPMEINNTFKAYYECLYKSECPTSTHSLSCFLDGLEIPSLTEVYKNELDSPIEISVVRCYY